MITIKSLILPFLPTVIAMQVHDGDTLRVNVTDQISVVRLAHIDAPELEQPYGISSRDYLKQLVLNRPLILQVQNLDFYNRQVAVLKYQQMNINQNMVKMGLAWWYSEYSKDLTYKRLQQTAISKKLGLWKEDKPVAPWIFRKSLKNRKHLTEDSK